MCECYANYPGQSNGCMGKENCRVLKEIRTPPADLMADYRVELAKAGALLDGVRSDVDLLGKMSALHVPAMVLTWLTKLEPRQAFDSAKIWWRGDKKLTPGLVLMGAPGTGKSVAAAWVAMQTARVWNWNGQAVGEVTSPFMWLEGTRLSGLSQMGKDAADELEAACRARLLVIDDCGREGNRPALEALSDVVSERIDKRRLTVLTSNLNGQPFRDRYGPALADRLRASAMVVNLSRSESMRKPNPFTTRKP